MVTNQLMKNGGGALACHARSLQRSAPGDEAARTIQTAGEPRRHLKVESHEDPWRTAVGGMAPPEVEGWGERSPSKSGSAACHLPLPPHPSIPYPTPMPTAHAPTRNPDGRGIRLRFFHNRIPCLENPLSATDSKIRSIPPGRGPTPQASAAQPRASPGGEADAQRRVRARGPCDKAGVRADIDLRTKGGHTGEGGL